MFADKFRKFFGMAPYHRKPTLADLEDANTTTLITRVPFAVHLQVDSRKDGWYLVMPDGEKYSGPYKRAQDAKGQRTRILNG